MARTRLELRELLGAICENCYFSPPSQLEYPCLIYELAREYNRYADNIKYLNMRRWTLTLIDEDPDSPYVDQILELPYCSLDRSYSSGNLNHWSFDLYF